MHSGFLFVDYVAYLVMCKGGGTTATLGTSVLRLLAQRCGLRQTDIGYEQFKQLLKTFLLGC